MERISEGSLILARKLSDEQIAEICRLRDQGMSYASIAAVISRQGTEITLGGIAWQCMRNGAGTRPERQRPFCRSEPLNGRFFTPEDDAQLVSMSLAGTSYTAIGKAIGRSNKSVLSRLVVLAARDNREDERFLTA